MGSSSPQQMPPPPDSTFSATESITTHDTLPPSKLIARDNVLLAGLLAAFAPSMADAHRLSIDDLHPDRNLLLFLHRLSPHICTDLTGDWLHTHPALTNNYRGYDCSVEKSASPSLMNMTWPQCSQTTLAYLGGFSATLRADALARSTCSCVVIATFCASSFAALSR